MRNLLTLGVANEAVMKCFAASWSIAIVLDGPPLPPAPGIVSFHLLRVYGVVFKISG